MQPPRASVKTIDQPDQPGAARLPERGALESLRCSFCGKRRSEVRSIVCGPTPDVAICDECVNLCAEIIAEQLDHPAGGPPAAA